jgi:hypothetical protein
LDTPLAVWQEPLVTWVFAQIEHLRAEAFSLAPEFYPDFCAEHRLWMASPLDIKIPIVCDEIPRESDYLLTWSATYGSPLTLAQVAPIATTPLTWYPSRPSTPGYAIVLATVVEYAEVTYGREKLSLLIAGLHDHTSWKTLIPEVFDVSLTDFEAGWHSYLVKQYNVSLCTVRITC